MRLLLKNARAYQSGVFRKSDILIADGRIAACAETGSCRDGARILDCTDMFIFPGLVLAVYSVMLNVVGDSLQDRLDIHDSANISQM